MSGFVGVWLSLDSVLSAFERFLQPDCKFTGISRRHVDICVLKTEKQRFVQGKQMLRLRYIDKIKSENFVEEKISQRAVF